MPTSLIIEPTLDDLIDHLADHLGGSRPDPFRPELIVVPSPGLQRWIEQQVAARLGVAANFDFLLPGRFANRLKALVTDHDRSWTVPEITGHIFAIGDPHATDRGTNGTWMGRARYIADLFDRYGMHRPEMVRHWAAGRDVDSQGEPLGESMLWQPVLWRQLCAANRLGASPADQLESLVQHIRTGEHLKDDHPHHSALPQRIHLFGLNNMSRELLALLDALSTGHELIVFAAAPSPPIARPLLAGEVPPTIDHPLLATWGRPTLDGLNLMGQTFPDSSRAAAAALASAAEEGAQPHRAPDALPRLGRLQYEIVHNLAPGTLTPTAVGPSIPADGGAGGGADADTSIQLHACSGLPRQVEVLRDQILMLLDENNDLLEEDITVICPRLDRFAPLIESIWGTSAQHSAPIEPDRLPRLRYRVNQTTLRTAVPLIEAVAELIDLVAGRVTHSLLASFLSLESVRAKFDLTDDDELNTAIGWFERTALRWGIDGEHRAGVSQLPADFGAHTLSSSIDALVASMALSESELSSVGAAALRVDLAQFELVGRIGTFAQELARLQQIFTSAGSQPMTFWTEQLRDAADSLFAVPIDEAWQHTRFDKLVEALCEVAAGDSPLSLDDLREAVGFTIDDSTFRRNFGDGTIVVDGPQALRSVPHRVVCILGFDEDAVPRDIATRDDLIAHHPQPGDRDLRQDAKQQLLDAVLAARDHLVITFSSRSPHTNGEIPPSVALQELIDVIHAGEDPTTDLVTAHTRYPHTASNFDGHSPRSFDTVALEIGRARQQALPALDLVLPDPLDFDPGSIISIDDLATAATYPTDLFARKTLNLRPAPEHHLPADLLPVELNALENWKITQDLLGALIRTGQRDDNEWIQRKRAAGQLPPGQLAFTSAGKAVKAVDQILDAARKEFAVSSERELAAVLSPVFVPIDLDIDDYRILGNIECRNQRPIIITNSSVKPSQKIDLWVRSLILSAVGHNEPALIIARDGNRSRCDISEDPQARMAALRFLLTLHRRARREVLPLFASTSACLADPKNAARSDARKAWLSTMKGTPIGDQTRTSVSAFFGDASFDDVVESPIGAVEIAGELWRHIWATSEWSEVT